MRIFYASMTSPNLDGLAESRIWEANLYGPLVNLGHDVVRLADGMEHLLAHADIRLAGNRAFVEEHRPTAEARLLVAVRAAHREKPVDLFFGYLYSACVTGETIRRIRALGIPTVNFFCNNVHQFELVSDIAPAYDYCMVPERATLEKYRRIGANAVHIQMAANPEIYKPYPLAREFQVTFVGQRYGDRPAIIDFLLRRGFDVRVWGPGWARRGRIAKADSWSAPSISERLRHVGWSGLAPAVARRFGLSAMERHIGRIAGPPLNDDEMIRLYSRSCASLGFSTVSENVAKGETSSHLRLRDFEAPMCGALYATGYTSELPEYFEPDREVLTYATREELADKLRYYLANPSQAERVRQAARRRAVSCHTWEHRFRELLTRVFGRPE